MKIDKKQKTKFNDTVMYPGIVSFGYFVATVTNDN